MCVLEAVDFCCKDEIAFGETIDGMCPDLEFHKSPSERDIRMMTLLFRQSADPVYKCQCSLKIGKLVFANKMVGVNDFPIGHLR